MKLGTCLNCKNHEDCTFQRVFPVMECDEFTELDLSAEINISLKDLLTEWGFIESEEKQDS